MEFPSILSFFNDSPTLDGDSGDIEARVKREKENRAAGYTDSVVDRVCKASPLGKKLVCGALSRGINIESVEDIADDCAYVPEAKVILMDNAVSTDRLAGRVVAACRRSEQNPVCDSSYSVYDNVREGRALAADAAAHECAAVYQMRKTEPYVYKDFCCRHGGMMRAFAQSFEKNKEMDKAKAEAFKAWYDDKSNVERQDKCTIDGLDLNGLSLKAFKKEMTSAQLAQQVPYVDVAFFDSAKSNTVSENTAQQAAKLERNHIRHALKLFGRSKIKTSADYFYVRDANGNVEPPKRQQVSLAAAKALANGGR